MDRSQKLMLAVMSAAFVYLAGAAVTANPSTLITPLYTFRMEQASSKMNFLPTAMNYFAYTAENGFDLDFDAPVGCCGDVGPLDHCTDYLTTCDVTCPGDTCPGQYTCEPTSCQPTCFTCGQNTCVTCCTCDLPPCKTLW